MKSRAQERVKKLILASVVSACGDRGEPARPSLPPRPPWTSDVGTVTVPSAPPPAVDERPLPRIAPPVDVVSTHGALAEWPRIVPGVEARAITSYDRSGGNNDGFAGTYSELYTENGEHVIFDAMGPGVLRTLWFTSAVDGNGPLGLGTVRFYFDDETAPRIAIDADALYSGGAAPFVPPLVADNQTTSGGFASWAPLVYRQRLKITTERRAGFYQAHYETFPPDWDVASTVAGATSTELVTRLSETGTSSAPLEEVTLDHSRTGAGTIDVLRFEPTLAPSKLELASARVRIWFDAAADPQVDVPLDMFFGSGLGEASVRAAPWTMEPGRYESRFPMPYFDGFRVSVSGLDGKLWLHVSSALGPREEIGTFTAVHRAERPTTPGKDYVYVDVDGAGKLVGTVLTVEPIAPTAKQWWEGDLRSYADELLTPGIHGTGHEDDHLGGWSNEFLERPFTQPMQGCPRTEILDDPPFGQTNANATMYRLFPGVPFLRHLRHSTEHGPSNAREANYSSVAFLYRMPRQRLVKTDERTAGPYTLQVAPDNVGVKLRRRYVGTPPKQRARVIVDGVRVGTWYVAEASAFEREDEFFVPPQITKAKTSISVTLAPEGSFQVSSLSAWTVLP